MSFPDIPVQRASRTTWICAIAALVLFLVFAIAYSLTRCPWWDEGLFADVAVNFRNSGHLRSSVLAPRSFDNMPDVNRYMYWQLPAYLVSLGLWFHVVPVSVQWMRAFSVMWGCVFFVSWFFFVRTVSRNETLALVTASIVTLDYSTLAASSDGRMDMMCAALGQLALAMYVLLRTSHVRWALLLCGLFGATSLLCHPLGAVTNAWIVILLCMDRQSWRWTDLPALVAPYVLGITSCLIYILQAPQTFLLQAQLVSGYRIGGVLSILSNIVDDSRDRYLQFFFAPHSGTHKLKVFCLVFGLAGFVTLLARKNMRRGFLPKFLIFCAVASYIGVAAIDDLKYPYYFIYVLPILSACGAIWIFDSWANKTPFRWIATMLLFAYLSANLASCAYYIKRDELVTSYLPTVASVRAHLKPGDLVMGPSELAFDLGFGPPLIDDCTLGFTSGLQPKVFVMYPACTILGYSDFIYHWSHRKLTSDYRPVLKSGGYTVYVRKP